MKILSNFDTKLKDRTLTRYRQKYGENSVVLIVKSSLFFFIKVFWPFFVFVLFSILILFIIHFLFEDLFFWSYILYFWFGLSLFVMLPVLSNYIEYKFDFTVITPKLIITYDQKGIFRRYIKTINVYNIKTIFVTREGFLYSAFNNGDLTFLSEGGGDVDGGEITLHYIYKPEKVRHIISRVLSKE